MMSRGRDVVHRAHLPITMIAGALNGNGAARHRAANRRRNRDQQRELEYEPAGGDAREARSIPAHDKEDYHVRHWNRGTWPRG
jgi:hypothetical protein